MRRDHGRRSRYPHYAGTDAAAIPEAGMATSVFSLFKVGIDPFSSHTAGPIRIAALFTAALRQHQTLSAVRRLEVRLCGSLSTTGVGHGTGRAVIMSLMDE